MLADTALDPLAAGGILQIDLTPYAGKSYLILPPA
jgi:hypothetical protein